MEKYLLLILFFVLYVGYTEVFRRIRLTILRDRLFIIREKLFLMPYTYSSLKHGDDVYSSIESYINMLIRYGHRTSFFTGLVFHFLNKITMPDYKIEITYRRIMAEAIEGITEASLKKEFSTLRHDIDYSVYQYLKWTSPLFSMYVGFIKVRLWTLNKTNAQKEKYLNTKLEPVFKRYEFETRSLTGTYAAA